MTNADLLLAFLGNHLWQSAAVALVLFLSFLAIRSLSSPSRHAMAYGALVAAAILPAAMLLPFGGLSFGGSDRDSLPVLVDPADEWAIEAGEEVAEAWAEAEAAVTTGTPVLTLLVGGLLAVFAAGIAIQLVRLGVNVIAAERLRRKARPAPLAEPLVHRFSGIDVRESTDVMGPMVVGLLGSSVILPAGYAGGRDVEELAGLLEHERAHVERRDPALAFLQKLILAIYWWSPAMHWIGLQIDREREMACDAIAAQRTGDARGFARVLAAEAEARILSPFSPSVAVGAMRTPSQLRQRIIRLIEPAGKAGRAALLAPLMLVVVVGAAAWTTPRAVPVYDAPEATVPVVGRLSLGGLSATQRALGEALVQAAMHNDLTEVRHFVEAGAPVDFAIPGDGSALIEAARTGNMDMARYLLSAGADVDLGVDGDGNPLIMASANGKKSMAMLLVEHGADVNAFVPGDETPLINAARSGNLHLVRLLVESGADVNLAMWTNVPWEPEWRSPLWGAWQSGNSEVTDYLLSQGAVHEPPALP
ncbi:ankyrin repeat domain-containing protein [Hyphobacterium marinum]|uniref:Ankyrin repeat domain-containing protein n=1 Tax=Hyphobacterium marinum TaxID=3116574 RepID=A0ABU7LY47_9PROT|nr:ankyrin repeat domain-containing protein [Hyphobacterium sp. Y6023]MEE2566371.1 ankyrin repeat domain-containing protein [Hyphobacterium sp. Y6023]